MPLVLIHTGVVKYWWQILILYSIQFAYPTYSGSPFSDEIAIMIRHYVIHPYLKIRHYVIHPTMSIPPTLPFFFYDKILAIVIYSSHLFCFDAFARTIINMWPLKWKRAYRREKCPRIFKLNLFNWCIPGFCQHFTENPLFISNKILAIFMSIPPTFPLFFYDKILAIIMSIPPTFPVLMPLTKLF